MDAAWYEREEVKDKLLVFGRAIQGAYPYGVVLEPDSAKCRGGFCSFDRRAIAVNPTVFPVPAKEQYLLTKALLVHEAGHKRHSQPMSLPSPVREIANILDDERVERLMCREFVGIRWLITKLAARFYEDAKPIDPTSDRPYEVVAYFLQFRWATRIGKPVKGTLSASNEQLWAKVEPLVHEAWDAETPAVLNRNAARIAEILEGKKHNNLKKEGP